MVKSITLASWSLKDKTKNKSLIFKGPPICWTFFFFVQIWPSLAGNGEPMGWFWPPSWFWGCSGSEDKAFSREVLRHRSLNLYYFPRLLYRSVIPSVYIEGWRARAGDGSTVPPDGSWVACCNFIHLWSYLICQTRTGPREGCDQHPGRPHWC